MKKEKVIYTREEKIDYYLGQIYLLKKQLERAEKRLEAIRSDDYQEWNSTLEQELKSKQNKGA